MRRPLTLWTAAACLPIASQAVAIMVTVEPGGAWLAMPASLRSALAADALLYTGACAIVAAPLAGVALGAERRHSTARAMIWRLVAAALLFAAVSAMVTFAWGLARADIAMFIARSHTTLLAVTLALAAWGALCGVSLRDPLDAAAVGLGVVLVATGGLLVSGAAVADLPQPAVAAGLAASPLVVIAAAANIDIVRLDLLYQISPLAHMQMEYPAWHLASGGYFGLAFGCSAGLAWKLRTWPPASIT